MELDLLIPLASEAFHSEAPLKLGNPTQILYFAINHLLLLVIDNLADIV